ncbi:MAG: hypothetical protein AAGJ57_01650, partial [Pseudomonadota bacterium]
MQKARLSQSALRQDWQEYTEHAFVQQLAQGTLAQPCFL